MASSSRRFNLSDFGMFLKNNNTNLFTIKMPATKKNLKVLAVQKKVVANRDVMVLDSTRKNDWITS